MCIIGGYKGVNIEIVKNLIVEYNANATKVSEKLNISRGQFYDWLSSSNELKAFYEKAKRKPIEKKEIEIN